MASARLDFEAPCDSGRKAEGALRNANSGELGASPLLILLKLAEQRGEIKGVSPVHNP